VGFIAVLPECESSALLSAAVYSFNGPQMEPFRMNLLASPMVLADDAGLATSHAFEATPG